MQHNGTTLPDSTHDLLVYKVDHKKFDERDIDYLKLPSTKSELVDGQKPSVNGLSLSTKDTLVITTNVCSTKLTQNGKYKLVLYQCDKKFNMHCCSWSSWITKMGGSARETARQPDGVDESG
jgi:C2 domain in Dock180 and Zizimin proteins